MHVSIHSLSKTGVVMYFLDVPLCAASATVSASVSQLTGAQECHGRLGHLAKLGLLYTGNLSRSGLVADRDPMPAELLHAHKEHVCEPCVVGKMGRAPHPARAPCSVGKLHRVCMDLTEHFHQGSLAPL
jgi:hypothetical protein